MRYPLTGSHLPTTVTEQTVIFTGLRVFYLSRAALRRAGRNRRRRHDDT